MGMMQHRVANSLQLCLCWIPSAHCCISSCQVLWSIKDVLSCLGVSACWYPSQISQ